MSARERATPRIRTHHLCPQSLPIPAQPACSMTSRCSAAPSRTGIAGADIDD